MDWVTVGQAWFLFFRVPLGTNGEVYLFALSQQQRR